MIFVRKGTPFCLFGGGLIAIGIGPWSRKTWLRFLKYSSLAWVTVIIHNSHGTDVFIWLIVRFTTVLKELVRLGLGDWRGMTSLKKRKLIKQCSLCTAKLMYGLSAVTVAAL